MRIWMLNAEEVSCTDYYFDRIYRFTFVVRDSRMEAGVVFVDVAGRRGIWGMSLFNTQQDFRLASSAVEN